MFEVNSVHHTDLFTLCAGLGDQSVDMILCDLPYGTTACSWDTVIPFEPMWAAFKRVIKPKGAIVLTASQPFTSALVMGNPGMFKYAWVWVKSNATDFVRAKLKPMGQHEDVLIFSPASVAGGANGNMNYFPQDLKRVNKTKRNGKTTGGQTLRGDMNKPNSVGKLRTAGAVYVQEFEGYPTTTLYFDASADHLHPTQKPLALFEYLIRTYTQEGDLVIDPCVGSGTAAVAARNTKRRFIAGDTNPEYVAIARDRLRLPFEKSHRQFDNDVSDTPLFAYAEMEQV